MKSWGLDLFSALCFQFIEGPHRRPRAQDHKNVTIRACLDRCLAPIWRWMAFAIVLSAISLSGTAAAHQSQAGMQRAVLDVYAHSILTEKPVHVRSSAKSFQGNHHHCCLDCGSHAVAVVPPEGTTFSLLDDDAAVRWLAEQSPATIALPPPYKPPRPD